jgi:hypothetical protein
MSYIVEYESFPIKRSTIKTTPSMSLQSVIDQACLQLNLSGSFVLQYKKSPLQSTLSVRLANIPAGSKLQLIQRFDSGLNSTVTIGLQTEDAGRLIGQFPPTTTLWQILRFFEQQKGCVRLIRINLTRLTNVSKNPFSNSEMYIMPVCVFMNREFPTIRELKGVSLRELGLTSGNAGIRLLNRITTIELDSISHELIDGEQDVSECSTPELVMGNRSNPAINQAPAPKRSSNPENNDPNLLIDEIITSASNSPNIPLESDRVGSEFDGHVKIYRPAPDGISQKSRSA